MYGTSTHNVAYGDIFVERGDVYAAVRPATWLRRIAALVELNLGRGRAVTGVEYLVVRVGCKGLHDA